MKRKLVTACMVLTALAAFALPAAASAVNDPQVTENGTLVAPGELAVGTSIGELHLTNTAGTANLLSCASAVQTGKILKNASGTVEAEITTGKYSGTGSVHADNSLKECTGSFGNGYVTVANAPLCARSTPAMAANEIQLGGGGCGTFGAIKFTVGSTTAGVCEFASGGSVKGDFTTNGTEAVLTIRNTGAGSGIELSKGGFLCPTSGMLKMSFGLETENGTKLTIS